MDIPALAEFVTDTRRCTAVGRNGIQVSLVEHLLAALALTGVTDCDIVVDAPELPALDGAALEWVTHIRTVGISPFSEAAPSYALRDTEWVEEGHAGFYLWPDTRVIRSAAIDIPATAVRNRMAGGALDDPAVVDQMIRARTYGLAAEVEALQQAGLALGGSLENAVLLTEDGFVNPQVWPNEPAWHKVLDLVGDLALVGATVVGHVMAVKAGHAGHVALAHRLRTEYLAAR
jgi:UDP-3-O-[3-hydroxymyristoyl] N-acetylglucosamine deacetylase